MKGPHFQYGSFCKELSWWSFSKQDWDLLQANICSIGTWKEGWGSSQLHFHPLLDGEQAGYRLLKRDGSWRGVESGDLKGSSMWSLKLLVTPCLHSKTPTHPPPDQVVKHVVCYTSMRWFGHWVGSIWGGGFVCMPALAGPTWDIIPSWCTINTISIYAPMGNLMVITISVLSLFYF